MGLDDGMDLSRLERRLAVGLDSGVSDKLTTLFCIRWL